MRFRLRTLLVVLALGPPGLVSGAESSELEKHLKDVLGESFDFVRGVRVSREDIAVDAQIDRFWMEYWFAELRAKKVGLFGLSYDAAFSGKNPDRDPIKYRFSAPVRINERGTRRHLRLDQYGVLQAPQANIGDIVILPVCLGFGLHDYGFSVLDGTHEEVRHYFGIPNLYEDPKETIEVNPLVLTISPRGESRIHVVQHWTKGAAPVNNPHKISHDLNACIQFDSIGEINLRGQLQNRDKLTATIPIRILSDEPIRIILGYIKYTAFQKDGKSKSHGNGSIPWGNIEVRVADQLTFRCADFYQPQLPEPVLIKCEPFKAVEPYQPTKE
jgi:hypothetical protein